MTRDRTDLLVVHCSATPPTADIGADTIDRWHRERGWRGIGYHRVIRRDGSIENGRDIHEVGAHCRGHNRTSVGICLVGGVDAAGKPDANFTEAQLESLKWQLDGLLIDYPDAEVLGHRDLSPDVDGDGVILSHEWVKACPSFDVRRWRETGEVS